ncbi:MAG TPA: hypothetical protein VIE43_26790 [Thermoanaerobaculia bacterium]|nr:hypothetical protein [Thermoanaerobaculia bacterium]
MRTRLHILSLAILLTTAVSAFAAPTASQPSAPPAARPATSANLLDAILGTGSPAPTNLSLGVAYTGYCSQTCSRCYSLDGCPPDPDTGFRQTCTRVPLC